MVATASGLEVIITLKHHSCVCVLSMCVGFLELRLFRRFASIFLIYLCFDYYFNVCLFEWGAVKHSVLFYNFKLLYIWGKYIGMAVGVHCSGTSNPVAVLCPCWIQVG